MCHSVSDVFSEAEGEGVAHFLGQLKEKGYAAMLIGTSVRQILRYTDRVIVMRSGMTCLRRSAEGLDRDTVRRYMEMPLRGEADAIRKMLRYTVPLSFEDLRAEGGRRLADARLEPGRAVGLVWESRHAVDGLLKILSGERSARGIVADGIRRQSLARWFSGNRQSIDALAAKEPDAMIVQPLFSVPDHCLQFNEKGAPLCFLSIAPEISEKSANLVYWYAGCFDTMIGEQQTNAEQRREGFETWMAANRPDVEILEVQYVEKNEPTNAQSIFEDWIQKYGVGGFDGVATQSSMQTQGIVSSMKSYDLNTSNFTLAGISASTGEWVAEGTGFVDLYQDPYSEATAALKVIRAMLDGTTDQLETMEGTDNVAAVPMTPITIENAADFT